MPILNGIELVKKIREQDRKTPIIMITAHIDKKYLMDAVELHMEKYLVKPIDLDMMIQQKTIKQSNFIQTHISIYFYLLFRIHTLQNPQMLVLYALMTMNKVGFMI